MSLAYSVIVLREKSGEFSVVVPALDGCATYAETLPQALRNVEEAILAYIDGLHALGKSVPPDVGTITVDLGDAVEASIYRLTLPEEAKVA